MSLVCLASAHGSPGVTTAALALAAAWPRPVVVVEADPFGGTLAPRFGLGDTPGLSSLAAAARGGLSEDVLLSHAQELPGGTPALVGPPAPQQAAPVLRDLAGTLAGVQGVDLVADCGRPWPGSPVGALLHGADLVLLVVRPIPDQLRAAAHRLRALEADGVSAAMLLVGDRPYGPAEVASSLGADVAGVLTWDPRAAGGLSGTGAGADLGRTLLARSAASVVDALVDRLDEPEVQRASGPRRQSVRGRMT